MTDYRFKNARFIKSIAAFSQKPEQALPEVAFAGRSNVGKSSLLNALTNRKNLAKISSKPGKTRLINYFLVNDCYYFVDLPGYGFAKVSKSVSASWQGLLEEYILKSQQLRSLCLLIDARHEMMKRDVQMIDWLDYNQIPFIIILTKSDKLSKNNLNKQLQTFRSLLPDHHVLPFSIKEQNYIDNLSKLLFDFLD